VKNSDLYEPDVRDKLTATSKTQIDSDSEGVDDRTEDMGKRERLDTDEVVPYVELWEYWIPSINEVVTLPDRNWRKPLRRKKWDGPEGGPYPVLSYSPIPNNILPIPPAAHLLDLHHLANSVFRKLSDQARRHKQIGVGRKGQGEDARRIAGTNDGEIALLQDPDSVQEKNFGGVDQAMLAFFMQVRQLFSYIGGNVDALAGLRSQSETLGQDRLLNDAANDRMADMQEKMVKYTNRLVRSAAWYIWHDQFASGTFEKRLDSPGVDIRTPFKVSSDRRQGEFLDYNFNIEAHSLRQQSPSQRLQLLNMVYQTFILPNQAQLAERGIVVDYSKLMHHVARMTNLHELKDILVSSGVPVDPFSGSPPSAVGGGRAGGAGGGVAGPSPSSAPTGAPSGQDAISQILQMAGGGR
jgi:hypothetical protein